MTTLTGQAIQAYRLKVILSVLELSLKGISMGGKTKATRAAAIKELGLTGRPSTQKLADGIRFKYLEAKGLIQPEEVTD